MFAVFLCDGADNSLKDATNLKIKDLMVCPGQNSRGVALFVWAKISKIGNFGVKISHGYF